MDPRGSEDSSPECFFQGTATYVSVCFAAGNVAVPGLDNISRVLFFVKNIYLAHGSDLVKADALDGHYA